MIPPKPSHPERLSPLLPEWEIYTGSVYLYIVGPGQKAMRRCSRRSIDPGTIIEREIAMLAVDILNKRHRESLDAGADEILTALLECGYEEDNL